MSGEKPLHEMKLSELEIHNHIDYVASTDLKRWAIAIVKDHRSLVETDYGHYCPRCEVGYHQKEPYCSGCETIVDFLIDKFELTEEDLNGKSLNGKWLGESIMTVSKGIDVVHKHNGERVRCGVKQWKPGDSNSYGQSSTKDSIVTCHKCLQGDEWCKFDQHCQELVKEGYSLETLMDAVKSAWKVVKDD